MHTEDMSAVQRRTKKLQQMISDTPSLDDAKLQTAFNHQIYDSEGRKLSFRKTFDRQYGGVTVKSVNSSKRTSSDASSSSRTKTSTAHIDQGIISTNKSNPDSPRRVLVIFIRHFLCGLCQEYLRRLSAHPSLRPSNLSQENLSVAIIGCGSPTYIKSYRVLTNLPDSWGLYADPTNDLYATLGMQRNLSMGDRRPIYIQRTMTGTMLRSVVQGMKRVPKGDVGRAGPLAVNGGEYLFELRRESQSEDGSSGSDDWQLKWCHQMGNSRDHTEVEDLLAVVGLSSTPSSPTVTISQLHPRDNDMKPHKRSYSTPLIFANTSTLNEERQSRVQDQDSGPGPGPGQAPIKRQFSLRRTLSTRRQSWLIKSNTNVTNTTASSCAPGGRCLANARARELL